MKSDQCDETFLTHCVYRPLIGQKKSDVEHSTVFLRSVYGPASAVLHMIPEDTPSTFPEFMEPQSHEELSIKELNRLKYRNKLASMARSRTTLSSQKHKLLTKTKKQRRRLHKPRPDLGPQSDFFTMRSSFAQVAQSHGIPLDSDTLNKVENLCALYFALIDSSTVSGFLSICFLYLKTNFSVSVAEIAATYLSELLDSDFDAQAGTFSAIEEEKPKWLLLLKDLQENWTLAVRNEGFKQISHVLSLALALGMCDASSLDFKIGGMKLFSIQAFAKQATAIDLIDAAFSTIMFFAEGGYMCFVRGSIKPLIYGDMQNEEFEEMYSRCFRCNEFAASGNLEKFENMQETDYESLMNKCLEKVRYLKATSRGPVEKGILSRKEEKLRIWQATFQQTRVQGGLREAPYVIGIYAGTSVGKSTIGNILMITTLMHNGYSASDDRIVTINASDKFLSNYRTHTNGVMIDDIGNTKPEFVEQAPTNLLIQLANNVRSYANMAEVDQKGKVSLEPKVIITTKNVKDSCASVYSNEPASITRRDRITITVAVKDEYKVHDMLCPDRVRALHPNGAPMLPDFWNIKVEQSYPVANKVKGKTATVGWHVVEHEGRLLSCIGLPELIRWVGQDSRKHFPLQKQIVANSNDLGSKIDICPDCDHPTPFVCICKPVAKVHLPKIDSTCPDGFCLHCSAHHEPLEQQVGFQFVSYIWPQLFRWRRRLSIKFDYFAKRLEDETTAWSLKRLDWLENSMWTSWTNWIPTDWLEKDWMKNLVWLSRERELSRRIRMSYVNHLCILGVGIYITLFHTGLFLPMLAFPLAGMSGLVHAEKKKMYEEVANDNKAMPLVFKMYRDKHVKWISASCAAIGTVYAIAQAWKYFKCIPSEQGNLAPTSDSDVKKRDTEVNVWASHHISTMPCSAISKTTTVTQLANLCKANLCHIYIEFETSFFGRKEARCDAFFMSSNVAVIPQHIWKADDMKVRFTRHDPGKIGGNFECYLYRHHSVHIPFTDLNLVWVPNGGDWKDLSDYLPRDGFGDVPGMLVYKDEKGECMESKLFLRSGDVATKAASFKGCNYDTQFPTFTGLCMAPIITETKGPMIGGFHLGGIQGATTGCSGMLTLHQFSTALKKLASLEGVTLAASSGDIPDRIFDVQFMEGHDVHKKSPTHYLQNGSNCRYYGRVTGRSTYHSSVEPTIITDHVSVVCGVGQSWGPPKFREGYPWQASLVKSTRPSIGMKGSLLVQATRDYIKPILYSIDGLPKLKAMVRPLSRMETVCGIDGCRFIDKIPPSTSVGFPLSGPKSKYLTPLPPADYPDFQHPVELDEKFWKHAESMEELYTSGKRAYPIFKACLKDEPTKLTKDKVRVFQGAPIALQLLVRKYYLPIARALSMLPLASECAVGINAQGPEWNSLALHVKKFGENRILAGDYKAYDLTMPAQVMFSAFRILIDIGRHCGYSETDVTIMEGIATDICYPLMAYNGDLIQHYGSNPSGQNLTVYINSIVNSLLFRCAYYKILKDKGRFYYPPFRQVCSLITYGDDAKSSVNSKYPEFNHLTVAQFLREHGMTFTMPDKEAEATAYMKDCDADLLKRKNIFSEDTGMIMGALSEDSIFKSLHSTLGSKVLTREQQAMQNIDGALREWFSHGRDVYERRRSEMIEVATRADIIHGCQVIHEDYDARLAIWKDKYAV